ncbi:hypothetical protein MNBD_GAMMA20-1141 [hydrothermal vent metagenome]|uniref:Zn-ribbon-containing, possibly RNA-binding protein and truncated derivatives n=1 Tax=hydrothermal vent metagenome TaxID=652676 RepID=A0A3B1AXM1_9ZZZZ
MNYNGVLFQSEDIRAMPVRKRAFSKSLASILAADDNGLQPLFAHAHRLQTLNRLLRGALGEPLGPHVCLCNIHTDTAIVTADSPAWLTQLRYQAPTILHILQSQPGLESLRKVRFKVQPVSEPTEPASPPRRASLSPSGAEILESAAEGIQDSELAQALRRLALNGSAKA